MAIPFFEPREAEPEMLVDQVDGHGGNHPPAPAHAVPIPTVPNEEAAAQQAHNESATTTTAQQLQVWKTLAVAMCKALKNYYQQTANTEHAFSNAVVQMLPNGQLQPLWK